METKTTMNVKTTVTQTRWVIGPGGVRMSYEEWLDMREKEM